ncbi:MAG: tetratricopeptide repeat protein [bacterium]|nr:tetratricopeptide repeat protein [bacterium]
MNHHLKTALLTGQLSKQILIAIALVSLTLTAFVKVCGCGFVNFDDHQFVVENDHIKAGLTGHGIKWAFTTLHGGNYIPLTWLSHMIDCQLFGLNPAGHHLSNLLFHLANTLLLFWVLHLISAALWPSALVAALFALHPLRVESVAWIAERKDVLSTFLGMLTIWAWARYSRLPTLRRYLVAFAFFCLGLLAKPMLVSLPLVLLLLDHWPLNRFPKAGVSAGLISLVLEKLPLLAISGIVSLVTLIAQHRAGAVASLKAIPLKVRLINALVSYGRYLVKLIWPNQFAVFYPYPMSWPWWQVAASALLIVGLSALAVAVAKTQPYLLVGWLWYLITLLPVIGLVQVGRQSMADRYTYVPSIGLLIMAVWAAFELTAKWCRRYQIATLSASASAVILYLMICTAHQVRYWKNSLTLFEHALAVTANNYLAHYNLGVALAAEGRYQEAAIHYAEAIRIKPDYACAHNNLGFVLSKQKKLTEAEAHYRQAIKIKPDWALAHYNLGCLLAAQGRFDEADAHYRMAQKLESGSLHHSHSSLVIGLGRKGKRIKSNDNQGVNFSKSKNCPPKYSIP